MHLFSKGAGFGAPCFCGAVTLQMGADSDSGGGGSAAAAAAATAARPAALAPAGRCLQSLKRLSLVRNARRARSCSLLALDQREQMLPGC